VHRDVPPPPEP
jgi:hypothetical protein